MYRILIVTIAVVSLAGVSVSAAQAAAPLYPRSLKVLMVPDDGASSSGGTLPTGGTVIGRSGESYDQFDFSDLDIADVDSAGLAGYDTVVLNQVNTGDLSNAAKQAIAAFVVGGGKLVIHDSDSTTDNDYGWLPAPAHTAAPCPNCGNTNGTAHVVENNDLVSDNRADASYVDLSEFPGVTDAIGDANVMTSQDEHWFKDIVATNGNGDTGAVHTYATVGGLIVFNGFDTDEIGDVQSSGVDWLSHMWFRELLQAWSPDGLPHGTPINCLTTIASVAPAAGTVGVGGQPGTTVAITGKSLCRGTQVRFGNKLATVPANVTSTTTLTATVPDDSTSGGLRLVNPDGAEGQAVPFSVDSYRNTRGFGFTNYKGVGKDFTTDDVDAAFGANAYVRWSPCKHCGRSSTKELSEQANAVYDLGKTLSGLCFGFSYGSMRLSQGVDPVNATADKRRKDASWNAANTHALMTPAFETGAADATPYDGQMRHYLYKAAISQYSSELIDSTSDYLRGLRTAANKGDYVYQQVQAAMSSGLALVSIDQHYYNASKASLWDKLFGHKTKNDWDGHALVGYRVERHPGGDFDIDVYDPNWPFGSEEEGADGVGHHALLGQLTIHVAADGSWSYDLGFDSETGRPWSGGPETISPIAFSKIDAKALHPMTGQATDHAVLTGGEVGQITDAQQRSLYDATGELVPLAQRVAAQPLGALDATSGAVRRAEPGLLIDRGGTYTETVGPGTQQLFAGALGGSVTVHVPASVKLALAQGQVAATPRTRSSETIALSRLRGGVQTTVTVTGKVSGALALRLASSAAITTAKAAALHVSISSVGGGQAPQTFATTTRLMPGERLVLGPVVGLRGDRSSLRVALVRHGHTRHRRLVNHKPRPALRLLRVRAKRARGITTVALTVRTIGAPGGSLVVTARRPGGSAETQRTRVRQGTVALRFKVGAKRGRLQLWTVAVSRARTSSRVSRRTVRVR